MGTRHLDSAYILLLIKQVKNTSRSDSICWTQPFIISVSHEDTTWCCENFMATMLTLGCFQLQYCSILMFRKSPYDLHNSLISFWTCVQVYKRHWPWRFPSPLRQWCLGMSQFTPVSIWLPVELLYSSPHHRNKLILLNQKGCHWHTLFGAAVDSDVFIMQLQLLTVHL